ncbi:hypothetical protein WMY93_017655 [Mugilogobius chulae]|uniref:COMM domain-containing protein n=1 Tax=Mugilogobius chulae TaxID=88201 RepID=A0AAW0NPY8_9GOBI
MGQKRPAPEDRLDAQAAVSARFRSQLQAQTSLSSRLCHAVVDGVCGRKQPQREDYSALCSLDEWLDLNKSLSKLFCLAAGGHSSEEELALSSDKISSLQTPLLNLSLDVREKGVLRPVTMEMTREELNTLISSLEAANKSDQRRID